MQKRAVCLATLALLLAGCGCKDKEPEDATFLPESGTEIWGYQQLTVIPDPEKNLSIKDITMETEKGIESLITQNNPLRSRDNNTYEISLCAECVEGSKITVTVAFNETENTVTRTYPINHMPVVKVVIREDGDQFVLDASESEDPEGGSLRFQWFHMGEIIRGALLTVDDLSSIQEEPAIVQASDGTTTVTDIMGLVPGTGGVLTPVFTPDHYVCEDLEIFTGHPPLLNGGLALGADPAVGTALPLDGSGNLMMDYSLGHAFEVRGTIIVPGPVFDEGQDVAYTIMLSGAVVSTATGQRRTPANRSVLSGSYVAPVPIPIAGSGVHPPMVFDNYDHHPNIGYLWRNNTPTGPQFSFVKSKGVEFQNGNMLMIWADKPSHRLDAGTNMNGGFYAVFYFRAWMDPDLTKCEKHFLVEIEVDGSGVVTKNELRMR